MYHVLSATKITFLTYDRDALCLCAFVPSKELSHGRPSGITPKIQGLVFIAVKPH
jgi:hypothetical protein